jgi:hypothetical protein
MGTAPANTHKPAAKKDDVGSSGGYTDEDFESISKSQSHQLPSTGGRAPQRGGQTEVMQKYVKKENKFTMTEQGKYNFMSGNEQPTNAKEWTMKRNLEDAEMLI